ncbi:transcriptional regulator [Rhodococcoides trifolii]|uniref:Transcriptional regulator n=1 Tax=Rhodococcoides trifolii TaxID=908250 RepID=A0A917LGA5_9NOCA|nr:WYL domain-containing protein [Rhodococcus trifolii]GGG20750.1 transcriptional regulator [Rhodococcus trifolii]
MRADRLLSLVLLLRNRGRMSAAALAKELDVSERTVLRDIDALSLSGFPVYAERGRHGGFELLPGFTTDLTGLTADEAKALMTGPASESLGMAPAFASAMRKVAASMSDEQRRAATTVAQRVLVRPEGFVSEPPDADDRLGLVQQAVFSGRRLRIVYGPEQTERTIDPLGLVHAGRHWYLLALHRGNERTYRLSRMGNVEQLDEPAERTPDIDLAAIWDRRRTEFRSSREVVSATVRVHPNQFSTVSAVALEVRSVTEEGGDGDGDGKAGGRPESWTTVDVVLGGVGHACSLMWMLGDDGELVSPPELRAILRGRAAAMAAQHS